MLGIKNGRKPQLDNTPLTDHCHGGAAASHAGRSNRGSRSPTHRPRRETDPGGRARESAAHRASSAVAGGHRSPRARQAVALEGLGAAFEQAGRVLAQLRMGIRPRPAEAQRVRQASGPREHSRPLRTPQSGELIRRRIRREASRSRRAVRQQRRLDAPKLADCSELMILNFKIFDPLQPPQSPRGAPAAGTGRARLCGWPLSG